MLFTMIRTLVSAFESQRALGAENLGIPKEVRELIRQMSQANARWGASRIHGELLNLRIEMGQAKVSKCMVRHRKLQEFRDPETEYTSQEQHLSLG